MKAKTKVVKAKKAGETITKDTVLGDLMQKHPEAAQVFFDNSLPCAMCHMAVEETVEQAAVSHGVDLDKLLKDLNKLVKKK
jgi:hybrid cluster-associated redox disulfide protein